MSNVGSDLKNSIVSIPAKKPSTINGGAAVVSGINGSEKKEPIQSRQKEHILILFYQEYPKAMPTHDEVVDQIKDTLLNLGYWVSLLPINQSIERITNGIKQEKPDLIFNLCETFRNNDQFDSNVIALLEMLKVPFYRLDFRKFVFER